MSTATLTQPATSGPAQSTAPPLTIWRSVEEVDADAWNSVRDDDDLFMDLRFLRAVESSMAPRTGFWYLLFRDDERHPVAIAVLSTYVVDGTLLLPDGLMKRSFQRLGQAVPWTRFYKVLFCGVPLTAGQSPLRLRPQADAPAIMDLLCRTMSQIAGQERARLIVMKEFADEQRPVADLAESSGFRRADSLPTNLARPTCSSFEDHLAQLKSSRRRKTRKSLDKLQEGGIRILSTSDPDQIDRLFTDDVHQLYAAMFDRSETKVEFMPASFFRRLVRHLPNNCRYQFVMDGETVLGFGISLFSGEVYHALLAGVDYDRNAQHDVYFNIMYDVLRDALDRGATEIHVGANADEFKQSRLGCRPDPRSVYIKGVRRPIRLLLHLFFDRFFPPRTEVAV